jgi:hypothetical protein
MISRAMLPRGLVVHAAVPRSAGDLLGALYNFSFFGPASAVARATAGSRLNANDQPKNDGAQFVERREPRHEMCRDRRADSNGQTDRCADPARLHRAPEGCCLRVGRASRRHPASPNKKPRRVRAGLEFSAGRPRRAPFSRYAVRGGTRTARLTDLMTSCRTCFVLPPLWPASCSPRGRVQPPTGYAMPSFAAQNTPLDRRRSNSSAASHNSTMSLNRARRSSMVVDAPRREWHRRAASLCTWTSPIPVAN